MNKYIKSKIRLGDSVKSKISGFTGIAYGYEESFNGSLSFTVQSKMKKGDKEYPQAFTIDAATLEIIKKQAEKEPTDPEEFTEIKLGDTVKTLSDIKGITFKRHVYWNRCVYFSIEYKNNTGILNTAVCSSAELTMIKRAKSKSTIIPDPPGGPSHMPANRK